MNINKLLNEIIPPADYEHRNGFDNTHIINQLTQKEKEFIEHELIIRLLNQSDDTLIIETLALLKSTKALSIMYSNLEKSQDPNTKIIIAVSIYQINRDNEMIISAIDAFRKLENRNDTYYIYKLSSSFYYLIKFHDLRVNQIIEDYAKDENYLISYNAKHALKII